MFTVSAQTGPVDYPAVEPWTELPSNQFLEDVLDARRRETDLVAASVRDDHIRVRAWVDSQWPSQIEYAFSGHLPQPGPTTEKSAPETIEYASVVHNRPLNEDDDRMRVAKIVMTLLKADNVDYWARAKVYHLGGPGWDDAAKSSRVIPPAKWQWSVEDGNHRLIAQCFLGIGPYAYVREAAYWR